MSQAFLEYDARKCNISVGGRVLTNFASGDMFSAQLDADRVQASSDAQGAGSVAINNSKLGTITINMSGNSGDNQYLNQLANKVAQTKVVITTPMEKISAQKCYITRPANAAYGTNVPTRTYTIKALDLNVDWNN